MPESGDPAQDPLMERVWEDVRGDSRAIPGVERSTSQLVVDGMENARLGC